MVYSIPKSDDILIVADLILDSDYVQEKFGENQKTNEELKAIVWEEVKKINQTLVSYKHIRDINIREKEFEKTTTLKIKRYLEHKN